MGLATITMTRDLKNSERLGARLQSKLSKAEVTCPCTKSLCHYLLKSLSHYKLKVSNMALASRLDTTLERICELEVVIKKVMRTLAFTLSLTLTLTLTLTLHSKSVG